MKAAGASLAVLLMLASALARAGLPAASDLAADGRQSTEHGKPIVILFSLPDCHYCKVVRENYLAPLLREANASRRPIVREVSITSDQRMTGFAQDALSQRELAKRYRVQVAPTVLFLDRRGALLAEPIVGGDMTGLYGGYIDNAFEKSVRKLRTDKRKE